MKIYVAGSTKELSRCKLVGMDIAHDTGHEILQAWVNLPQDGSMDETLVWRTCIRQIQEAAALVAVVPSELPHRLNGAVLEIGYALGRGIPVFVYDLKHNQSGTWVYAPGVKYLDSWPDLIRELDF